jgi:hypothetical protein
VKAISAAFVDEQKKLQTAVLSPARLPGVSVSLHEQTS